MAALDSYGSEDGRLLQLPGEAAQRLEAAAERGAPVNALLLLGVLSAAPAIDQVVVFPDRAQVTRVADITCAPKIRADFIDISPAAGGDSFRARVSEGTV